MTETATEHARRARGRLRRQEHPAEGGRPARPGPGRLRDDVKRHGMGYVHFVRAPYAHAKIVSVDVSAAEALEGVYGTLTPDEVAELTDPFFELTTAPGNQIKDYALAVGRVRHIGEPVVAVVAATRELASDAADLVEVEYEPLDVVVDARRAQDEDAAVLHDDAGTNVVWSGVFDWGDVDGALKAADRVVRIEELHFDRFSSTPLECSAALVEHDRGTGQFTIHCNHQMPGVAAIWMGPALRVPLDKLRFVTQDIGGGFGNKITTHVQLTACCLLARKLKRPIQWTEWRTDQHTANAHGNERWFHDIEVAVQNDGTMLGFKVKALDDCGAFPRYEPLGCIIWAQVTPGLYRWRNIRVDFTQVVTNKSPVAPNRGYSRMQQLWLTERIIDIVAHELGLDPVEVRKKNYVKTEEMPYETPNGCVYDSGDYARCLDIALELIDYEGARARQAAERTGSSSGSGSARRSTPARTTSASRRSSTPSSSSPGTTRWRRSSSTSSARSSSPSARCRRARATRRSRARSPPTSSASRPTRSTCGPGHDSLLELACGVLRHVRVTVRGHRARGGQGRDREALARDPAARRRRARRRRPGRHRPRGRLREDQGQPGGGAAVHGLRRDHQRQQRRAPAELRDITLNCRHVYVPPFEMPDFETKFGNLTLTYATQIHACVVEIDPETGHVELVDYAAVDDCGIRIHPQIVEGQVHGATAHAIGAALHETFAYDEYGQLLTANFYDYHVPTRSTCRRSRPATSRAPPRSPRSARREWAKAAARRSTRSARRSRTRCGTRARRRSSPTRTTRPSASGGCSPTPTRPRRW